MTNGLPYQDGGRVQGSPESEKYIISACLSDPNAIYQAQDYIGSPSVFMVGDHRLIWEAMEALQAGNSPIDQYSVSGQIKKVSQREMMAEVMDLALNTTGSANLTYHCQIVVEWHLGRVARSESGGFIQKSLEPTADVFECIDELQSKLEDLTTSLIQGRPVRAGELTGKRIEVAKQRVKRRQEAEARGEDFTDGIPSGIYDFDKILNGFLESRLYIVAARPGMGKSAKAMNNYARHAGGLGHPSLYKSLEMPKEELTDRMLCAEAGVNYGAFQQGRLGQNDFSALDAGDKFLKGLPVYIEDRGGESILKIRAGSRKYKREFGLKMLAIDNLSLIKEKGYNRENEMARISGGLKRLAIEMQIPIIAISHLNRECEKRNVKIPALSDLRDSGAIEQDADCVIFIYRPWYYGKDYAVKAHNELWNAFLAQGIEPEPIFKELALIEVSKNRGLMTGDCWVRFVGKYTRFEHWTDPRIRQILDLEEMPVRYKQPKAGIEEDLSMQDFPF